MIFAAPTLLASPADIAQEIARDATTDAALGSSVVHRLDIGSPFPAPYVNGVHDNTIGAFGVSLEGPHRACAWARAFAARFSPFVLTEATFFLGRPDGRNVWFHGREGIPSRPDFSAIVAMMIPAALANTSSFRLEGGRPGSVDLARLVFDPEFQSHRLTVVELPALDAWWERSPWLNDVSKMTLRFAAFQPTGHKRAEIARELEATGGAS